MKENSIEEDIKILKELGQKYYKNGEIKIKALSGAKYIWALQNLLSDYKRVLKENEELKSNNEKYIIHLTDEQYKTVIENAQNDINQKWIQKVKDKIEEEIKYHEKNILDIENITMLKGKTAKEEAEIEFNKYAIVVLKKMLQELLEGRK